jgi:protein-disulfide isomerase
MKRILLAAGLAAFSLAAFSLGAFSLGTPFAGALAQTGGFTPEQRQAIVQIVRDALKNDPSILRDAVNALQTDDAARDAADAKARIAANHDKLYSRPGDAVAGNANGDVALVEFYDPRCPYCKRMLPALDALVHADHGVRLIYKEIPVLGPASVTESRAILAAQNQGGYFKMQTALMGSAAEPTDAMIRDAAKSVGLDPGKLLADMKSEAVSRRLQDNLALAHELKVDGTPAFIVGNQLIPGAVGEDGLEAVIASARKKS